MYSLIRLLPVLLTGISIYGNGIGENTGATMPQVVVKDNEGSNIYSYNNTSKTLVLSSKATDTYKLTNDIVSVEYAFVRMLLGLN